ncbi:MAG: hypothetical protein JO362_07280 [Streptomycetaceae bacterium]|nr:hypothetical protein [Streptomycetaceae bacterium]
MASKNLKVRAPAGAACLAVALRDTHAQLAPGLVIGHPSFLVGNDNPVNTNWVTTDHQVRVGQWVRVIAFASNCATARNQNFTQPLFISQAQRVPSSASVDDQFAPVFIKAATTSTTSQSQAQPQPQAPQPQPQPQAPQPAPSSAPLTAPRGGTYVQYNGGAHGTFTESPKVYLVFYGSQWNGTGGATQAAAEGFFKGLGQGGETWSRTLTQYCSGVPKGTTVCPATAAHIPYPTSTVYAGTWFDNSKPAPQAPGDDLIAEARAAATHFGVTDPSRSIFIVFSPAGTKAGGGYSWHTTTNDGYSVINAAYGWQDTNVLSHEYAETLTDVNAGWTSADLTSEIGDLCGPDGDITLPTGSFPVVSLWSNSANACVKG